MIPTDWEFLKLQDTNLTIIDGDRGNNYPKSDEFTNDGFCLFLSAKNITKNGFRLEEKQFISEERDNLLRKGKLKDLDIIITTRGSVGHIAYNENIPYKDMRINSGMVILRNNDKNINQKYIYKLFASSVIQRQIEKIAFGSAQPQLTVKEINNLKLPLPPLKEQEKIANILSTADDKIDAIASRIQKAETLKKGLLQKLLSEGIGHSEFKDSELGKIPLSWKVDTITSVSKKINVGFVGTCEKFYTDRTNGVLMIRTGNIKEGKIDLTNLKYISYEFHNKNTKSQLKINDLLIARHGSSGLCSIVPEDFPEANCLNIVMIRIDRMKSNPIFTMYLFNSNIIQTQMKKKKAGSTQGVVNTKEIAKTMILIPPLEEQKQIADILSTADEKLEVLRAKKEKYETLKKGLLQKLLSGEVRV